MGRACGDCNGEVIQLGSFQTFNIVTLLENQDVHINSVNVIYANIINYGLPL